MKRILVLGILLMLFVIGCTAEEPAAEQVETDPILQEIDSFEESEVEEEELDFTEFDNLVLE